MITTPSGAQFEISVDGKPRSYRDMKIAAPLLPSGKPPPPLCRPSENRPFLPGPVS
jgi:hypothetical protein